MTNVIDATDDTAVDVNAHDGADTAHDGGEPVGDGHVPAPTKTRTPNPKPADPADTNPTGPLFALPLGDALRVDAALLPELEEVCQLRWPGIAQGVALAVLLADAYADLSDRWAKSKQHPSEVVRGYTPPQRASSASPLKAAAGSKQLVERLAGQVFFGAPGQETVVASYMLRHGINRARKVRPTVDPALVDALGVLTASRRR